MTQRAILECNGCGTTVDTGHPQPETQVPPTWATLLWGRNARPTMHLCPKCLERITIPQAEDPCQ